MIKPSKPSVAKKTHKKPKVEKPQQQVKKPQTPIQPAQPIGPIGGFPGVSTPGFMRGLARQSGMMKGDVKQKSKIQIKPKLPMRKLGAVKRPGAKIMSNTQGTGSLGVGKPGVLSGKR